MKLHAVARPLISSCIHLSCASLLAADPAAPQPSSLEEGGKRFSEGLRQLGGLLPGSLGSLRLPQEQPSEPGTVIDFEEGSPLGRVLRMLATQAGINYLEPAFDPNETVAITLHGVSAKEAF